MVRFLVSHAFVIVSIAGVRCLADDATSPVKAEKWAALPPDRWPQMVLTNHATFNGHSDMDGASSFLIKLPDSTVAIGTAKHLIKEAGGVNPPLALEEFDHSLTAWQVYPRTHDDQLLTGQGLDETPYHESRHDWLIIKLKDPVEKLPAAPLTLREKPAEIGETVYLIGVPYSDHESAQRVYKGKVVARPFRTFFKYEFQPPVHIPGFSGAPIVDSNGLLVGHGVSRFTLKQENGLEVEFGGEDANVALDLWKHRDDPTPEPITNLIHMDVPDGWTKLTTKSKTALLMASNSQLHLSLGFFAKSKLDYDQSTDLKRFCNLVHDQGSDTAKLANRAATEPQERKIGERTILQYDVTGVLNGNDMHYRSVFFESNGCFCQLTFWSHQANWDSAEPQIDSLIALPR